MPIRNESAQTGVDTRRACLPTGRRRKGGEGIGQYVNVGETLAVAQSRAGASPAPTLRRRSRNSMKYPG